MSLTLRYVGLDVHKDTIVIAVADVGREAAEEFAVIAHDYPLLLKKLKRLGAPAQLRCCYEAGPTGYGLYRRLREAGIDCQVVAPSLAPTKAGDRVKTDRRDAKKLAHFLRSGDLTPVDVPSEADEALRDLERAREDAKRAERAARHQLSKFLLCHGRHWSKSSWTQAHLAWIAQQTFDHEAQTRVLGDYLKAVGDAAARVASLTLSIGELVERTTLAPLIKALQALRGVELIAATTIAAEIGDLKRFATPRQFMAYVGITPSERSTGQSQRRRGITKTGNAHVRRVLVEAAWNYRFPPRLSVALRRRNERVAAEVQRIAWKAQERLHRRLGQLLNKGKTVQKAVTAVARELAGFVWAIGQQDALLADGQTL